MSNPSLVSLSCVPSPVVAQAVDNVLILKKTDDPTGITVEVARWPFMVVNQKATLHVCGQQADGSPVMLRVADAEPVTQQEFVEGWRRNIAWASLQNLKDGSPLVFVFQAALDGRNCACSVLFPTLCLEVQAPFEDTTTFSADDGTDDWNGWMRGDAATDRRDLTITKDGDIYVLFNYTSTNNSAGTVLKKTFQGLKEGRSYEFGLTVRRWNTSAAVPVLSLDSGSQVIAPATEIPTMAWVQLKGTFTASSSQTELQIVNHVPTGGGNDFAFREVWVRSI
ncbi:carbohydrate binding domain-containing protein [Pseudomonas sp. F01002]|uniref:carbohydrate binding domain-containing protein n=1 Tax=Pseudomonas sp. F01002 TaxID=2555724 RepID=UPI00106DABE3|nr:carbohydrate binding domain-containing protein [Pseudomonas sp. F01002]TFB42302.1 sugar-binding protein [Pseudomonas sp. F01002]